MAYAAIISFFEHNRVALPKDRGFKIRGDVPPVERKITVQDLRRLIELATDPMRSMILVKWAGVMDTAALIHFSDNYAEKVVEALKKGEAYLKVEIPGRKVTKNKQRFYTFIGQEALSSLKEYFDKERGWPKPGEPIWIFPQSSHHGARKITYAQAWIRLLRRAKLIPKKAGAITSRYGYNAHNTRDLAISTLNTVPGFNPQVAEVISGHLKNYGFNQSPRPTQLQP
jgi:integrase